jgi:hypothetical protein
MKQPTCLALMVLAINCAFAQPSASNYEWKATLKVVDENGSPIARANAGVGFFTNSIPTAIDGMTDANGVFVAVYASKPSETAYPLSFRVEKQGYYSTWIQRDLGQGYDPAKWIFSQTVVLKTVQKPIAMYAKFNTPGLKVPEYGKPIAYDLEIGDWVGPHGRGVSKDIIFQKDYYDKGAEGYYSKVTVSFPKTGDGIQVYSVLDTEKGSGLRSPHEASVGGYQPKVTREVSALRGQPSKFEYDANRIYLFRVRTVLDNNGNVVSTHYGKIYGDFMQFTYYLNPTPNDRNIEFDPKQNLVQGLESFEQVKAP